MERYIDTVIIGAGLTGLTAAFHLTRKGKEVHLLEQEDRVGGQIRTWHQDGFTFESGPNTGAVSHPEVAELFQLLAPECALETAREEAKKRWIWKGSKFHELPAGIPGGLTTPLFTWYDKFRILGEPFRSKGTNPDEPVGALARRRLGQSYLDYAVDPFISGVYAGDPMTLTTRYALPKLYNLEQQYGGFIKGGIAKAREPKSDRDRLATKKVFSAVGGLGNLVEALENKIGKQRMTLSAKDIRVNPIEQGWEIRFSTPEGEQIICSRKVITTTGGYTLPGLLPFISKEQMGKISNLHYAPIVQASVGVRNTEGLRFNAFGGLIPSKEKKDVLGILFPSACFKGRSPEEGALFSFFMGGVRKPELLDKTESELEELVSRAFHELLKFPVTKEPDLIRIFRHSRAIPQYGADSGARFEAVEQIQKQYPGLIIAGNLRNGIGMADRIKQGTQLADIR